jgi:hypothetical protein
MVLVEMCCLNRNMIAGIMLEKQSCWNSVGGTVLMEMSWLICAGEILLVDLCIGSVLVELCLLKCGVRTVSVEQFWWKIVGAIFVKLPARSENGT